MANRAFSRQDGRRPSLRAAAKPKKPDVGVKDEDIVLVVNGYVVCGYVTLKAVLPNRVPGAMFLTFRTGMVEGNGREARGAIRMVIPPGG